MRRVDPLSQTGEGPRAHATGNPVVSRNTEPATDRDPEEETAMEDIGMKDLVLYMARALVDHPDKVEVNAVEGENSVILELKVAQDDVGKVIGKGGQTAKAMRKVLSAAATKLKKKSMLQIVE